MFRLQSSAHAFVGVALLISSSAAMAQGTFWDSEDAFLGAERPADVPIVFAPGRLAEPGSFVMGRVAFSRDGREFYYTQGDSWESLGHAKIKLVRFVGDRWEKPVVINEQFVSPTLSMDGKTLYFRHGNMQNLWQSQRTSTGWSSPSPVIQGDLGVYDFMPTELGRFYVGSDPQPADAGYGATYVFSRLAFTPAGPRASSLGQPLNTRGFNGDFFIARDESYMIVSTNETPDYESELYISFRKPDDTWTVPTSLGPAINNGRAHRWGQLVTADGKFLFYSHGTSEKDCAVYWARFDRLLSKLRRVSAASPSGRR